MKIANEIYCGKATSCGHFCGGKTNDWVRSISVVVKLNGEIEYSFM